MGFKIEMKKYCDRCPAFEPSVESGSYILNGSVMEIISDTIVKCTNADKCNIIEEYLKNELNGMKDPFSFK